MDGLRPKRTWDVAPLGQEFFLTSAPDVAPRLLNCVLVVAGPGGVTAGRITETEAYTADDPASHSYRGRTRRNAAMFQSGGHVYVYRSYGVHWCLNVVTGREGTGEAVLIRALEPLQGAELMAARRGPGIGARLLCAGPGRVCEAMAIDGSLDGAMLGDGAGIMIQRGFEADAPVAATSRIGITQAASLARRFVAAGDPWTSRPADRRLAGRAA